MTPVNASLAPSRSYVRLSTFHHEMELMNEVFSKWSNSLDHPLVSNHVLSFLVGAWRKSFFLNIRQLAKSFTNPTFIGRFLIFCYHGQEVKRSFGKKAILGTY